MAAKFEIKKPLPAGNQALLPAGFDAELPNIGEVSLPSPKGLLEPMPGEKPEQ